MITEHYRARQRLDTGETPPAGEGEGPGAGPGAKVLALKKR
jgi:hypothetical protein